MSYYNDALVTVKEMYGYSDDEAEAYIHAAYRDVMDQELNAAVLTGDDSRVSDAHLDALDARAEKEVK